jgi:hypothetical protein
MNPFRLGINMAGAISAGAYTAGVFDFIIQALQQWEAAKTQGQVVPGHTVSIEVLSGASAGAMCSAMAAMSLYDESSSGTAATRLHSTWVEDIDISDLLKTDDLKGDAPVTSILDCSVLDEIAKNRLRWQGTPSRPTYISQNLTLFLSLTNLRGIPYSVDFANAGSFEERILYHADQVQFEMLPPGTPRKSTLSYELPTDKAGADGWSKLRDAALATGAFPVGLRARNVLRNAQEYQVKLWNISVPGKCDGNGNCICEDRRQIEPSWDASQITPNPFGTVNVDGGVTNNNPFECARQYLASLGGSAHNPRNGFEADRAVLTVAPFPGDERFSNSYKVEDKSTLLGILPDLLSTLISQSRFQGENLSLLKDESVFSRFVIAPVDETAKPPVPALQSSSLYAFGGFLYKGFREHDYQLGRRNCQRFLQEHFVLPIENPMIAQGLGSNKQALIDQFSAKDPSAPAPSGISTQAWMPIIPLCGTAIPELPLPPRQKIPPDALDKLVKTGISRLNAVAAQMVKGQGFFAWLVGAEIRAGLTFKGQPWLKDKIMNELKLHDSLAQNTQKTY